MLTVTVDTAVVLSYSNSVISNSIFFDLNFQIIFESCSLVYSFITQAFFFVSRSKIFASFCVSHLHYLL